MAELLIELFSEEIPARMQARAAEDFCKLLHKELGALMSAAPRAYYGPRRIALVGEMAASAQTAAKEERGPRIGAPDAAIDGFLRKHGASREQLTEQGQFWVLNKPGETLEARDLLAKALPAVLRAFPWPKSMRWGTSPFLWVRPLQRVVCILGGEVLRFPVEHGVISGDETEGHRVHAPGAFRVTGFADYVAGLRERKVVLDAAERMAIIRDGVAALAAAEGLEVVPDEGLLAEVAGLVEWPVPLLGRIDDAFMDLPPEVMRTTMRINQKYFALRRPDGSAAPRFALVANISAIDGGAALVAGNERVLRARLSDARFFWDLDRKQKLEDFLPKLETVVFHAKLGTQGERVRRLEGLAGRIAAVVYESRPDVFNAATTAAAWAKADLATGMVGEFPELQGIMGGYYAMAEAKDPRVPVAIRNHYRPLGPTDEVPSDPVSICVALADKLDQMAGFFAVGEKPTGSGDPFALRRAALGVIRIVRENGLRIGLRETIEAAVQWAGSAITRAASEPAFKAVNDAEAAGAEFDGGVSGPAVAINYRHIATEVLDFLFDRLRVQLRAEGARHDVVNAVLGSSADDDLVRLLARAEALRTLIESPDGANLLAAYRRAANILRIEEKKDGPHDGPLDPALLTAPEEQALAAALDQAAPDVAALLAAERFADAMAALAQLRAPLDAFFEKVLVNEPQFRANRLRLLSRLRGAMDSVAELSKIEG